MIDSIVLKNTELGSEININRTFGDYWLNEADFGQVQGTNHIFKFIDQIGETVYNTTLEAREISISGWVAAWSETAVHRMKKVLNSFVNPKHLLEAYVNNKKIRFYPRTSVVYSPTLEENNEYISSFLISGYCPYPLFTDVNPQSVLVSYTERLFKFPLIIPKNQGIMLGIRQPTLIATIDNTGDLPVGYIIEFRAYGRVVNPIIIDIGSQQSIEIVKELQSGEVITVDTREGYRHITGSLNGITSNYFKYRSYDSSWLTLERGVNYIRYNAEDGVTALEVAIEFEAGYLEVDT